jgi:hypothetical protein
MTKKLAEKKPTEAMSLIEQARMHFGQMQNSWWQFAKSIHAIKDKEAFKEAGYENFKFFCQGEYPTMNYVTIVKFMAIVESMQEAIESRLKDDKYRLPSYEACYTIVSVKDPVIPKEEISKLRKAVLDSKLSYMAIREKLKELMKKKVKDYREKMDTTVQELEKELTDDLTRDEMSSEEELLEEFETMEEEVDDSDGDGSVAVLLSKVEFLIDNLPEVQASMTRVDDEIVDLATALEKLNGLINNFLDKVEEKSK